MKQTRYLLLALLLFVGCKNETITNNTDTSATTATDTGMTTTSSTMSTDTTGTSGTPVDVGQGTGSIGPTPHPPPTQSLPLPDTRKKR
jgi:hypothetical protein